MSKARQKTDDRYERSGVREFWLVDPEERSIEQLVRRCGRYKEPIICADTITLRIMRNIRIDLSEVR